MLGYTKWENWSLTNYQMFPVPLNQLVFATELIVWRLLDGLGEAFQYRMNLLEPWSVLVPILPAPCHQCVHLIRGTMCRGHPITYNEPISNLIFHIFIFMRDFYFYERSPYK